MDHVSELRRKKQMYLREQIIEENWNPEEFAEFLADRRDEGYLIRRKCRLMGFWRTCVVGSRIQSV